jgi:hypothetical protein
LSARIGLRPRLSARRFARLRLARFQEVVSDRHHKRRT